MSLKKALSLKGISKNYLLLGGAAILGFAAVYYLTKNGGGLFNPDMRVHYAADNSMNSLGMWPVMGAESDRPFLPQGKLPLHYPRSFNDESLKYNQIAPPFLEVNFPRDYFRNQVRLNNVAGTCEYVQTFDGQGAFGHTG